MGPLQELQRTRGRQVRPVDVLLGWPGENHRQADRVHAELVDLGTQVDSVAQRLAHRPALVDHLSLVHQSAHRFLEVDHPMSYKTLVKNRMYSRCKMACSTPPTYWKTGIHRRTSAGSNGTSSRPGEQ